jgi:carbon-monoxide dehydrogenase medium subunit
MLRKLREFEYLEPSNLSEVISLLDQHSKAAKILAGGTDLLVDMKQGALSPGYLINIKGIPDQDYIKYDKKKGLRMGALTTIRQIETSRMIREQFLPLAQAAKVLGSVQVRNRATIGGNLCNASPSAETAPPLTEIMVPPPPPHTRGVYMSISRRRAVDLALVGVAVAVTVDRDRGEWKEVKIALGAVAPTPMRACKAEKILKGKRIEAALMEEAAQMASDEARPISDVRASAWYREEMVRVLVQRALEQVSRN